MIRAARRTTFALLLAAATAAAALIALPATAHAATAVRSVLSVGQSLARTGSITQLSSPGGRFRLRLLGSDLASTEQEPFTGSSDFTSAEVWNVYDSANNLVSLQMQSTGAAVLYDSHHHAVWHTPTLGTGKNNRLIMLDDGNIAVYSSGNKLLWAAGSGPELLAAGQQLKSGQHLVSSLADIGGPRTVLTMRTDGNLVLTIGTKIIWQTKTHTAGSYLSLQTTGTLVVYSPKVKAQWAVSARRGARTWLTVNSCVAMLYSEQPLGSYWQTPLTRTAGC